MYEFANANVTIKADKGKAYTVNIYIYMLNKNTTCKRVATITGYYYKIIKKSLD